MENEMLNLLWTLVPQYIYSLCAHEDISIKLHLHIF